MPTLQVISHEQDPGQKQMLDASASIADTLQRSQALKLTGQYYKILAKNAETEHEKYQLDRTSKFFTDYAPQIASADPATQQMLLRSLTGPGGIFEGDPQGMLHTWADAHPEVMKNYNAIKGQKGNYPGAGAPPVSAAPDMSGGGGSPGFLTPGQQAAAGVAQQQQELQARLPLMRAQAVAASRGADAAQNTSLAGNRPFWDKLLGTRSAAMQALEDKMQTEAEDGGLPSFPENSPAAREMNKQSAKAPTKVGDVQFKTDPETGQTVAYIFQADGRYHKQPTPQGDSYGAP